MDADGSHHPEQLPDLLAALTDADLVLGSRYVPGGRVEDWPLHRLLLSRAGNVWTRWSLRLPLADATGGYSAGGGRVGGRGPVGGASRHGESCSGGGGWG